MTFDILTLPNVDLTILSLYLLNALIIYYVENAIYRAIIHWIKAGPNTSFEILPLIPNTTYIKEPI